MKKFNQLSDAHGSLKIISKLTGGKCKNVIFTIWRNIPFVVSSCWTRFFWTYTFWSTEGTIAEQSWSKFGTRFSDGPP